jgi:hypothetical protein
VQADDPSVTFTYEAKAYGGTQDPNVAVLHSIECPLADDYARVLTGPAYFGGNTAGVSSTYVVGPDDTCQGVPEDRIAYHVGGGNRGTIAIEQTGRAQFTRTEWLTGKGEAQLVRVATLMAGINRRRPDIELRWLTDDELRAARNGGRGGFSTHNQFRRVVGGTTHHDPWRGTTDGDAYPWDLLMDTAIQIRGGSAPAPAPTPDATGTDDDMPIILQSPGKPDMVVFGDKALQLKNGDSTVGLKAAGVTAATITGPDWDEVWQNLYAWKPA